MKLKPSTASESKGFSLERLISSSPGSALSFTLGRAGLRGPSLNSELSDLLRFSPAIGTEPLETSLVLLPSILAHSETRFLSIPSQIICGEFLSGPYSCTGRPGGRISHFDGPLGHRYRGSSAPHHRNRRFAQLLTTNRSVCRQGILLSRSKSRPADASLLSFSHA